MKLTKTWLSYILWVLFSIIFCTNVGIAAIEINQKNNMTDFLMPMLVMYGGTIFGILLLYVLYKVYEKYILKKLKKNDDEKSTFSGPLEWFAFAIIIFVAIAVRVIAIISSTGQLEGTTFFYEDAIGNVIHNGAETYSNGCYIYTAVLGFILSFLGHIPTAAMGVQAGIQVITIIVAYLMVKKALGILPAWIGLLLMAFLPGSFLAVRSCTPDGLFSLLFVLFLWTLVSLCEANRTQKIRNKAHVVFYVSIGVFAAILSYYDVIGVLCAIITIVAFLQYKNEDAWAKVQKSWFQILYFLLSYVLFFLGLLWFFPIGGNGSGPDGLVSYFVSLIPSGSFNLMILTPHKGEWDSLALFILAGIWFVGFLRDKKDKAFPYVLMIVSLTLLSFLGIGNFAIQDYPIFLSILWTILASIGITSIDVFRKNERDVAVAEKAKRETIERKEKRERRRAEAAGEKSFNLEEVHKKKKVEEPVFDRTDSSKKSYGIGRKTDVPYSEENNNPVPMQMQAEQPMTSTVVAGAEERPVTVVKSVDKPPVVSAPVPVPIESKPAYSQGSRSRRALRSPSKSTFTQEDLERISRYTGVSYMASHTIISPVNEEVPVQVETVANEQIQETEVYVAPAYIELDNTVTEPTITVSQEMTEVAAETLETKQTFSINNAEVLQTESVMNDADTLQEIVVIAEEGMPQDIVLAEYDADKQEDASDSVTEVAQEKTIETVSPLQAYASPSRRHYRQPSKSTFTQDELEKIRQYTGVQYNSAKQDDTNVVKETDAVVAEIVSKPVVQSTPVTVEDTAKKRAEAVKDIKDIKQQPDRQPKLIRNPLPGPKPHVPKELNYDYIPTASEMKFDIEDLKGRDYFDL